MKVLQSKTHQGPSLMCAGVPRSAVECVGHRDGCIAASLAASHSIDHPVGLRQLRQLTATQVRNDALQLPCRSLSCSGQVSITHYLLHSLHARLVQPDTYRDGQLTGHVSEDQRLATLTLYISMQSPPICMDLLVKPTHTAETSQATSTWAFMV